MCSRQLGELWCSGHWKKRTEANRICSPIHVTSAAPCAAEWALQSSLCWRHCLLGLSRIHIGTRDFGTHLSLLFQRLSSQPGTWESINPFFFNSPMVIKAYMLYFTSPQYFLLLLISPTLGPQFRPLHLLPALLCQPLVWLRLDSSCAEVNLS